MPILFYGRGDFSDKYKSFFLEKHYKNRGFSKAFFEKQMCVTKRPFSDQKTQIQKFQLSLFAYSFHFQQEKTQQLAETPISIVF